MSIQDEVAQAADVAKDNDCPFGQWLYGPTLPAEVHTSADYATVRNLHADFPKCAAQVIECVGQGNKAKAETLMHGDYAKISGGLTSAMMKWMAAAH
jgi:hypothetical protein